MLPVIQAAWIRHQLIRTMDQEKSKTGSAEQTQERRLRGSLHSPGNTPITNQENQEISSIPGADK